MTLKVSPSTTPEEEHSVLMLYVFPETLDAANTLCSALGISIPTSLVPAATESGTPAESGTPTATASQTSKGTTSHYPTATATGAATHIAANGLGVAGAAFAAYLFL